MGSKEITVIIDRDNATTSGKDSGYPGPSISPTAFP
jgi:hypothetical protein